MKLLSQLTLLAFIISAGKLSSEGEQPTINPHPSGFTYDWTGQIARTYFTQWSTDLEDWTYFPIIYSGDGTPLSQGVSSSASHLFLRLASTDLDPGGDPNTADFDGDGLGSLEELTGQYPTDPLNPDSDGDHFSDGEEFFNFSNPNDGQSLPTNLDTDQDGVTDVEEMEKETDRTSDQSFPPRWTVIKRFTDDIESGTPTTLEADWVNLAVDLDSADDNKPAVDHNALLAEHIAFPEIIPVPYFGSPAFRPSHNPDIIAEYLESHESLSNVRYWLERKPATDEIVKVDLLIVNEVFASETSPATFQLATETCTIPANQPQSNPIDLIPQFTAGKVKAKSSLLPVKIKGIDDTEDPEVIGDIASGVDTTSRTADEGSEGYTEDIWIMAPIAGENRVEMTLGASASMNMTLSADKGFPSAQLLTKSPEIVSGFGEGTQSTESVVELSVEGSDKIDLPVKVKNMERRLIDVVVHPIALLKAGGGAEPPRLLPSRQEIEDYLNRVFEKQVNVHCSVTLPPIKSVNWDIADGSQAGNSPHYLFRMVDGNPPDPNVPDPVMPSSLPISAPGDRAFDIFSGPLRSPEQAAVIAATQVHPEGHIHVYLIGGCSKMRNITIATEEQSPEEFAYAAEEGIGGTHHVDQAPGECWVDANRVANNAPATEGDILYTIAHEIGHYVVGTGHPDEGTGPAPLQNADISNRLMISGGNPLKKIPPGIQLVKKEWDAADKEVDDFVKAVPN